MSMCSNKTELALPVMRAYATLPSTALSSSKQILWRNTLRQNVPNARRYLRYYKG